MSLMQESACAAFFTPVIQPYVNNVLKMYSGDVKKLADTPFALSFVEQCLSKMEVSC